MSRGKRIWKRYSHRDSGLGELLGLVFKPAPIASENEKTEVPLVSLSVVVRDALFSDRTAEKRQRCGYKVCVVAVVISLSLVKLLTA